MLVANPVQESYEMIREKYDGFCVLVVECDNEKMNYGTGKVIAYHEDLATLVGETIELTDGDVGIFRYDAYTNTESGGPIQVVHHG
ncbi:MAG: hypothetical protein FWD90_08865 [Defluviitaleaceae bacterium]|nr:hypothetical protein [Defluviitaleaceae bacterium]